MIYYDFFNVTNFRDYLNQNEFRKSKMEYIVAGPKLVQGCGLPWLMVERPHGPGCGGPVWQRHDPTRPGCAGKA
jgi:hypothetical protein